MKADIIHLLYADDDEDDRMIFQECFTELQENGRLTMFQNGLDLLNYLTDNATSEEGLTAICDMKMPVMGGPEVLRIIRAHKELQAIPFFIYSTSSSRYDREATLKLGATCYLTKPDSYDSIVSSLKQILSMAREQYLNRSQII